MLSMRVYISGQTANATSNSELCLTVYSPAGDILSQLPWPPEAHSRKHRMYLPDYFNETRLDVLHECVRQHPLASLITLGSEGLNANHIPFELDVEPAPYGTLRGHVARANPVWRDHSREIDDGKMLAPAFGQWPGRFSLVIDNNEILACIENLAEVIISVAPDAHGG